MSTHLLIRSVGGKPKTFAIKGLLVGHAFGEHGDNRFMLRVYLRWLDYFETYFFELLHTRQNAVVESISEHSLPVLPALRPERGQPLAVLFDEFGIRLEVSGVHVTPDESGECRNPSLRSGAFPVNSYPQQGIELGGKMLDGGGINAGIDAKTSIPANLMEPWGTAI